jgi:hypothetical protein
MSTGNNLLKPAEIDIHIEAGAVGDHAVPMGNTDEPHFPAVYRDARFPDRLDVLEACEKEEYINLPMWQRVCVSTCSMPEINDRRPILETSIIG